MQKPFVVLGFALLLATAAIAQGVPPAGDTKDPIAFVGHGAAFDSRGNQINITPEFIREAQNYYLNQLLSRATPAQRKTVEDTRSRALQITPSTSQNELVANSQLIESLANEIKPPKAHDIRSKNSFLNQFLQSPLPAINQPLKLNSLEKFILPSALQDTLKAAGLAAPPTPSSAALDYIKDCSNAGVPIPPDYGDVGWVNKGQLNKTFISPGLPFVEVLTYASTSPEGLCLALPRAVSSSSKIMLAGIICLGKQSGKACFWDNQKELQQFPIERGTIVKLTDFAGGPSLEGGQGGTCTSCHAGENPFIIHPKTALGNPNLTGLKTRPDTWYQPLVSKNWPQNVGPTNILDSVESPGSCTDCHIQKSAGRFPTLSTDIEGYCTIILPSAILNTMPPGGPNDPDYSAHVNALLAACSSSPKP